MAPELIDLAEPKSGAPDDHNFSILLFACKSALVASFKGKYSFEFRV